MSPYDIQHLAREGRYREAEEVAYALLEQFPGDLAVSEALGWVWYRQARAAAEEGKVREALPVLEKLPGLRTIPEGHVLWRSAAFLLRKLVADTAVNSGAPDFAMLRMMAGAARQLPYGRPSEVHSALLGGFLKGGKEWVYLMDFVYWWGIGSLRTEDFEPFETREGKRLMSLAERLAYAAAKSILVRIEKKAEFPLPAYMGNHMERVAAWLAELQTGTGRRFKFLPYARAQLMAATGKQGEALGVLKPFAMRHATEAWVWGKLAALVPDSDLAYACRCRGMMCHGELKFKLPLAEAITVQLLADRRFGLAKGLVEQQLAAREIEGWTLKGRLAEWAASQWFQTAQAEDVRPLLQAEARKADDWLFGSLPVSRIEIGSQRPDKRAFRVTINGKKQAELLARGPARKLREGSVVMGRLMKAGQGRFELVQLFPGQARQKSHSHQGGQ